MPDYASLSDSEFVPVATVQVPWEAAVTRPLSQPIGILQIAAAVVAAGFALKEDVADTFVEVAKATIQQAAANGAHVDGDGDAIHAHRVAHERQPPQNDAIPALKVPMALSRPSPLRSPEAHPDLHTYPRRR
jgi:hypothetical protein